jgi:hypothetical protein
MGHLAEVHETTGELSGWPDLWGRRWVCQALIGWQSNLEFSAWCRADAIPTGERAFLHQVHPIPPRSYIQEHRRVILLLLKPAEAQDLLSIFWSFFWSLPPEQSAAGSGSSSPPLTLVKCEMLQKDSRGAPMNSLSSSLLKNFRRNCLGSLPQWKDCPGLAHPLLATRKVSRPKASHFQIDPNLPEFWRSRTMLWCIFLWTKIILIFFFYFHYCEVLIQWSKWKPNTAIILRWYNRVIQMGLL